MTTKLSNIDNQKTGANIQTEGHTLIPPNAQNGPEEIEAFGSTPTHSPSQSPVRKPTPDCPGMWYCLEIQVISTEDGGTTPPPPHAWQIPVVEDMVGDGKSSLTEAVVTGPDWSVLFYGQWSLGEGLSLGVVQDAMFILLGAIGWVDKQAHLNANPVSLGEGWWLITQAITKWYIKSRGPGHPQSIQPVSLPFNFGNKDQSPQTAKHKNAAEQWEVTRCDSRPSYQEWGHAWQKGWDWGQRQQDQWTTPPTLPLPSPDHRFESDSSSVSTFPQCHWGSINLEVPGIHTTANDTTGNPEVIWKSTCQSSKIRTWKMLSPTKVDTGI